MKSLAYAAGGFTGGLMLSGLTAIVSNQLDLLPGFIGGAFATAFVGGCVLWADMRSRDLLLSLVDQLIVMANDQDNTTVYHEAMMLRIDLKAEKSLSLAAKEINILFQQLERDKPAAEE